MSGSEVKSPGQIILGWWSIAVADRASGAARGLAARLRRATPASALAEPAVHNLASLLGLRARDAERLSLLVRLLAEVREHGSEPLAKRLGGPEPALSTLRFQRLMRAEGDELCDALRRAIGMADGRCNVAALGQDILRWDDKTRMAWCFNYFGENAPQTEKTESE
ncbi:type I-E CRISPR-associated protein Cse2/CasB [Gemmobacter aquarius]|uniref:Type I-E CRISPR-associated protein Cse2/CasB n=1 Tax=Paragemmobacter aquarius TaxID=2169400 RepID=A0A2S0UMZ9_9RHOB|nr:type I-E CRISPR-associated protein Cse2/CasB [Gemmobacter aquarius]AWB49186.1 type I-E CRISPR-associated protein Cse2/CasB [Gemmobacter aquarius]